MLVDDGFLSLSVDEPVVLARPSIDVLFESAGDTYRERCVGVLLTGSSEDGARGLYSIGQRGGCTIVQDPDEAASGVAPRAALALFRPQHIVRLTELSRLLLALAGD
jgi:two-component system chemotaxis response regulator CheB